MKIKLGLFVLFLIGSFRFSCFAQCDPGLSLPSISFRGENTTLTADAKNLLSSVVAKIRNSPNCKVVVSGYCQNSKTGQQRGWDRVNVVTSYLIEQGGIRRDRLLWDFGQTGGDCNVVDLRPALPGEDLPTSVPAPHPDLSVVTLTDLNKGKHPASSSGGTSHGTKKRTKKH
jgi:hypothetical protein